MCRLEISEARSQNQERKVKTLDGFLNGRDLSKRTSKLGWEMGEDPKVKRQGGWIFQLEGIASRSQATLFDKSYQ